VSKIDAEYVTIIGPVEFRDRFTGSLSAGRRPGIASEDMGFVWLYVVGDNPLVNETLLGLEGQTVACRGTIRGSTLRVESLDAKHSQSDLESEGTP
jgi:hypothetical protein